MSSISLLHSFIIILFSYSSGYHHFSVERWKWKSDENGDDDFLGVVWIRIIGLLLLGVGEDFSHLLELGEFLMSIGCFSGCLNSTSRVNYFRNLNRRSVLFDALNQFEFWGHSWNFRQGKMCQNHLTFAAAPQNIFRWHRNDRFLLNPQNIGNNKLQNKKTNNNNRIRRKSKQRRRRNIFFFLITKYNLCISISTLFFPLMPQIICLFFQSSFLFSTQLHSDSISLCNAYNMLCSPN